MSQPIIKHRDFHVASHPISQSSVFEKKRCFLILASSDETSSINRILKICFHDKNNSSKNHVKLKTLVRNP